MLQREKMPFNLLIAEVESNIETKLNAIDLFSCLDSVASLSFQLTAGL